MLFNPRRSQKAWPTSWSAASWALCRSPAVFWCGCMAEWRTSTWTGTGRWRCSRSSTLTAVVRRSTAASATGSATSSLGERCWMMSCSDSPPSTGHSSASQKGMLFSSPCLYFQLHIHSWKQICYNNHSPGEKFIHKNSLKFKSVHCLGLEKLQYSHFRHFNNRMRQSFVRARSVS